MTRVPLAGDSRHGGHRSRGSSRRRPGTRCARLFRRGTSANPSPRRRGKKGTARHRIGADGQTHEQAPQSRVGKGSGVHHHASRPRCPHIAVHQTSSKDPAPKPDDPNLSLPNPSAARTRMVRNCSSASSTSSPT